MIFVQPPPELGNQYLDDRVLRSYLARTLPEDVLAEIEPALIEIGELAGGELYRMQLEDRENEPVLIQWDAWGNRIDRIEVSPLWREAERIAAEQGLVAIPHERKHCAFTRVHLFASTLIILNIRPSGYSIILVIGQRGDFARVSQS
jgi:hypothetical protein